MLIYRRESLCLVYGELRMEPRLHARYTSNLPNEPNPQPLPCYFHLQMEEFRSQQGTPFTAHTVLTLSYLNVSSDGWNFCFLVHW